ncbi:uncharacterized protein LOC144445037 [Glandiceps talaboti]
MMSDQGSPHSTEADVKAEVNNLYKCLTEIEDDHVHFSRQRNYFINALKYSLYPTFRREDIQRTSSGVRTIRQVRAFLSCHWSSESDNSNSGDTIGTLETFLDLTDQLDQLREKLETTLPDHVKNYCTNELDEWKRFLSDGHDFSLLDKEKYTLDQNDWAGYSGVVSLLPCVLDTANAVFQILGEYFNARKNTPYRPQIMSTTSNENVGNEDDEVFATTQSVQMDEIDKPRDYNKENKIHKFSVEKKQKIQSPKLILRKDRHMQTRDRRRAPSKTPRKTVRQKTHFRVSPRVIARHPTVIEVGKGPIATPQYQTTSKLYEIPKIHQTPHSYKTMPDFRATTPKQVISPRLRTPLKRAPPEEDQVRFPHIVKTNPGQRNWHTVEDNKNAKNVSKSQLPILRSRHGNETVSPRYHYHGNYRNISSPSPLSQSFPRAREGKLTSTTLKSNFEHPHKRTSKLSTQVPYPAVRKQLEEFRISTSSQGSAEGVPVSVVYHGSTIYNYPAESTINMDQTNKAIQRMEERLLPQISSLKDKVKKRDFRQREDSNLLKTVEDRLQKMEDEIADIKTRQLLHNYYLKDASKVLTSKDLDIVKDHVAYKDMLELGMKLGLTEIDVEDVKEETNKPREQVFQLLMSWRNKFGKLATLDTLIEVLIDIKRRDTANNIILDMKNRS